MMTKEKFTRDMMTLLASRRAERTAKRDIDEFQDESYKEIAGYIRDKMGSRGKHARNTPFYQC